MLYKKELISIVGLFMLIACSSSLWDDLPEPIATFISTYYPMSGISEYNEHNGVYYLMELELTDEVYAAKNDPREVILDMLDYKIRYIKESGDISQIGGPTN